MRPPLLRYAVLAAPALVLPLFAQPGRDLKPVNEAIAGFKSDIIGKHNATFFGARVNDAFEASLSLTNMTYWAKWLTAYAASFPDGDEQSASSKVTKELLANYMALYPAKTETQAGSTSTNSGTTSLAMKGAAARILSIAAENGGLTREQNGTTVTFRGKPLSLLKALNQHDYFGILAGIERDPAAKFWDKFSFAASFDTSRGGVSNTLLANSKQLTSWSLRAELLNERDAGHRAYVADWRKINDTIGKALIDDDQAVIDAVRNEETFKTFQEGLQKRAAEIDAELAAVTDAAAAEKLFATRLTEFQTEFEKRAAALKLPADKLHAPVKKALGTWTDLRERAVAIANRAQRGRLATFDWTTKRDDALPDLYSTTFVFEYAPFATKAHDFTFNVAANFYRTEPRAPSTANRFKSFDAVAQYDIPLGEVGTFGKAILTFAGKYQYVGASVTRLTAITSDTGTAPSAAAGQAGSAATTPAAVPNLAGLIPTIEGSLGMAQAKISFPIKGGAARIPLAFTAATRSEAFGRPDYRAQVGITFDLDTLFAGESAAKAAAKR